MIFQKAKLSYLVLQNICHISWILRFINMSLKSQEPINGYTLSKIDKSPLNYCI